MKKNKIFLFTTLFLFLSFLLVGGFNVIAEEGNGESESEEEIEEETEEEIEEEIGILEKNQNRAGKAYEAISRILERIDEEAPQREVLLGLLEKMETIRENTRERIEEALQRKEEAKTLRQRLEQNNRIIMIKTTIGNLLGLMDGDEEKEGARGALRTLLERMESLQSQIKIKVKQ